MDYSSPQFIGGACFVSLVLLELVFSLKYDKELYQWKDLAASGTMGFGSAIIAVFSKAATLAFFFIVYFAFNPEVDGIRTNILGYESFGYAWYTWLICQILDDLSYYWFHRANHEVRFFWAAHIVHHSSDHFNLGTGLRNGWFTLAYKPLFYMWLPAIGFNPVMVMTCLVIESFWQFQLHTKFVPRISWLESFLNMQSHHMVHHASNLEYLDKNHGGYLNLFDRIFGTFKTIDESNKTHYGVLHPPESFHPWTILTHEYKDIWKDTVKAKTWKGRFMYVFGPPGWSEDGSTKSVKQLQREMAQQGISSQAQMDPDVFQKEATLVG